MHSEFNDIYQQVSRQIGHWSQAISRLSKLDELASVASWKSLEHYLNIALKSRLEEGLNRLQQSALKLQILLKNAKTINDLKKLQIEVDVLKKQYLRTETMLDFYTDAINTRTNYNMATLMRACDYIANKSMKTILEPLGKKVPPVLTYVDKGLGASILKANLRLWDGKTNSPVAAIKVVRHNLYRPTALIHEAGHQVAHILNWNKELANVLYEKLKGHSIELAELWSGWASEIAADTFAFVHTGYAAIAGLHDVVSGDHKFVFRYRPLDPHPISYLRVLLGISMCKLIYGEGPWNQMERVWKKKYTINLLRDNVLELINKSLPLLIEIAKSCLETPMKAFKGKPITYWINPKNVSPKQLSQLVKQAGLALNNSHYWISKEAIRLLALSGYQIATNPKKGLEILEQQRQWMLKLGGTLQEA